MSNRFNSLLYFQFLRTKSDSLIFCDSFHRKSILEKLISYFGSFASKIIRYFKSILLVEKYYNYGFHL